jgi:aspartyl/asparaginyl-tRNA synthetase
MKGKLSIVLLVIVLIVQAIIFGTVLTDKNRDRSHYQEQLEIERAEKEKLLKELNDWRDHASRMKKIIGIEHEGDITWVDKVSHPIDTKALYKMKISKRCD